MTKTDVVSTAQDTSRILVVDDHPVNCELLEAMLAPVGYDVEVVYSGADAIQRADTSQPDLILLDVHMPDMDGFEVAQRLRASEETRLIPIVMVTALGDLEHRVRGLESGADDYLPKPVNRAELLARVESTLRLSYYRRQVDERKKLDLVLGDVSDGILITDEEGRLRDASPSARRLLALDGEVAGLQLDELWGDLHCADRELVEAVRMGRPRDFELQRDDPPLVLAASLRPVLDMDNNPTGAVLSLRDTTRESMERKLQQDVLSLVSHKFRTPLTVMTLWTKMLTEESCGTLTEQQREGLEALADSSNQLCGLLDGMLSYIEWSKRLRYLNSQPLSYEDLEKMLRHRTMDVVGLQHSLVVERDDEGELLVDTDLFLETLVELVCNAVKFGGDKAIEVRVSLVRKGQQHLISVQDNGPGIPPEQLERIFERFYQVETHFTGQVHGVGLGLALVKAGVEALGGRIQVTSHLNSGTRFEILL